jgi:hypothetical protein
VVCSGPTALIQLTSLPIGCFGPLAVVHADLVLNERAQVRLPKRSPERWVANGSSSRPRGPVSLDSQSTATADGPGLVDRAVMVRSVGPVFPAGHY